MIFDDYANRNGQREFSYYITYPLAGHQLQQRKQVVTMDTWSKLGQKNQVPFIPMQFMFVKDEYPSNDTNDQRPKSPIMYLFLAFHAILYVFNPKNLESVKQKPSA